MGDLIICLCFIKYLELENDNSIDDNSQIRSSNWIKIDHYHNWKMNIIC